MQNRPFSEEMRGKGWGSNNVRGLSAFLLGASLTVPIIAFSSATHASSQKTETTRFQTQTGQLAAQNEDLKHTILLQQRVAADQQAKILQQTIKLQDQATAIQQKDSTISSQSSTITSLSQRIDSVRNGLRQEQEDHPFWRLILDGVIQFLIDIGCDFLKCLL